MSLIKRADSSSIIENINQTPLNGSFILNSSTSHSAMYFLTIKAEHEWICG